MSSLIYGEKPSSEMSQLGRISNDLDMWYDVILTPKQLRKILDKNPVLREQCFIDFDTLAREELWEMICSELGLTPPSYGDGEEALKTFLPEFRKRAMAAGYRVGAA